jgi:hypothetical protein
LLRSESHAAPCLRLDRLCAVLDGWAPPPADIDLLSPTKASQSAKTRGLVDVLHSCFAPLRHGVAWRGVAWRGLAWRGVAWLDSVLLQAAKSLYF